MSFPCNNILLFHPAIPLVYCCIALVLVMAFVQPALSAIAFACVVTFGLLAFGVRSFARRLLWQLPLIAGITLLNAIFVPRGTTVLLVVGSFALHEESLLYGLSMGLALAAVMELFALLGEVVSGDDALDMASGRFPASSLLASMSLRLVPRMRRNAQERRDALRACTALPRTGGRLKAASEEVSVMIANAMEDSLATADSMRARGYGGGKSRTRYRRRGLAVGDWIGIACVVILGALALWSGIAAFADFTFYPQIQGAATTMECIPFAAFFLLPHVAYLAALARWHHRRRGALHGHGKGGA